MKNIRPTTDRAKEALFNILSNRIDFHAVRCLDLFSGTGSLGYELCSRGSLHVVCVDKDPMMVSFIQQTASSLAFTCLHAIRMDAWQYLQECNETFDLIIADPPYASMDVDQYSTLIFARRLLVPGGYFVLEHHSSRAGIDKSHLILQRNYGDTSFSIFQEASE